MADDLRTERRTIAFLLLLVPRGFRARFGSEMTAYFFTDLLDAAARGPSAEVACWVRTACGVIWLAACEYLRALGGDRRRDPGRGIRQRGMRGGPRRGRAPVARRRPAVLWSDRLEDVRYAFRTLRKHPSFAVVAIGTFGIGIGASATGLAVRDAVFGRPLPFRDPERLVVLERIAPNTGVVWSEALPPGTLEDVRNASTAIEDIASVQSGLLDRDRNLTTSRDVRRVDVDRVTVNFFSVLGVPPLVGRVFEPEDETPGATAVAVLSHRLWIDVFDGDVSVFGKPVVLNDEPYTIVGIMPEDFGYIRDDGGTALLWLPYPMSAADREDRYSYLSRAIGRLRDGVSLEQAQAQIDGIVQRLAERYPEVNRHPSGAPWGIRLTPLHEKVVAEVRLPLLLVGGAVGLVLLIVWTNGTMLLTTHTLDRSHELAVRSALGAVRWRIARQVLTEIVVLSGLGGAVALGMTWLLIPLIQSAAPPVAGGVTRLASGAIPLLSRMEINGWVLATTLAICLVTAIVCSVAPVLRATVRVPLAQLRRGGEHGPRLGRGSRVLVSLETSIAVVLLVGSAMLFSTMRRIADLPMGFDSDNVATLRVELAQERFAVLREGDANDRSSRWSLTPDQAVLGHDLASRIGLVPGVETLAVTTALPVQLDAPIVAIHLVGLEREVWQVLGGIEMHGPAYASHVTPDYFQTLSIPLLEGRSFESYDAAGGAPNVVIVNQQFVDFFGLDRPVGQQILVRQGVEWRPAEIVGVVGNVRRFGYPGRVRPDVPTMPPAAEEIYVPFRRQATLLAGSQIGNYMTLNVVARVRTDPTRTAAAMRDLLQADHPDLPVTFTGELEEYLAESLAERRFQLQLIGSLAVVALVLALIGVYGMMAFQVSRRVREIGIRMSLGADSPKIMRMVLRDGSKLATLGALAGVAGSLVTNRAITPWLYEVNPTDPGILGLTAAIVVMVALLASWIPARRAAAVNPIQLVRSE